MKTKNMLMPLMSKRRMVRVQPKVDDINLTENINKLTFMSEFMITVIDNLAESRLYKRAFKKALKDTLQESEKVVYHQFKAYAEFGELEKEEGGTIDAMNIYTETSKAYEYLLNKQPHEIVVISELIKAKDKKGFDYKSYDVPFKPIR